MNKNNNSSSLVKEDIVWYNVTLLVCYFLGLLGVHRIINRRILTGILMFVISVSAVVLMQMYIEFNSVIFIVLSVLLFLGAITWWVVDNILIMIGKFKVGKPRKQLISGKKFSMVVTNVIIVILLVISLIAMLISLFNAVVYAVFYNEVLTNLDFQEKFEEQETVVSQEYESKDLSSLKKCVDGMIEEVYNRESFEHDLEEELPKLGYELSEDVIGENEIGYEKFQDEYFYGLTMNFGRVNTRNLMDCSLNVSYMQDDYLDNNFDLYTTATKNRRGEVKVTVLTSINGEEIYLSGEYLAVNDTYYLQYKINSDSNFQTYNIEEDKFNIMQYVTSSTEKANEEYEKLFN